jgi:hypothetical protein
VLGAGQKNDVESKEAGQQEKSPEEMAGEFEVRFRLGVVAPSRSTVGVNGQRTLAYFRRRERSTVSVPPSRVNPPNARLGSTSGAVDGAGCDGGGGGGGNQPKRPPPNA